MNIDKIQLVSVPVTDQDRARDFYVDTLGLELVRDNPMGQDQRWVEVARAGASTGITLVTWFPTMPAGSTKGLVLQTADVDGDVAWLTDAGVAVEGPQDAPWAGSPPWTTRTATASCSPVRHPPAPEPPMAETETDEVFAALASPVRRRVLGLLRTDGPQPVHVIAGEFAMRRPSVSEHLKVLRDAGLVSETRHGRERVYQLRAEPLEHVSSWLQPYERFWRARLKALRDVLDEEDDGPPERHQG